jgi:hypothetical protein
MPNGYCPHIVYSTFVRIVREKVATMDCVTMKLVERSTVLPLDLVVLINNFLYERLTDENFREAIRLWFGNKHLNSREISVNGM